MKQPKKNAAPPKPSEFAIELLRDLVRAYTRHHSSLQVDGADMTGAIVLALKGDRDDHPKLVGSAGKHIQALQTILSAHGAKIGRKVNLTLLEPTQGIKGPPTSFIPNPGWKPDETLALIRRVLDACMPCDYRLQLARVGDLHTIEIVPAEWSDFFQRGDFARALHAVFHAVGKTHGADLHVNFAQREAAAAA